MAAFFPQVTGTFKLAEHPLRRFAKSPLAMGLLTGVAVRAYRAVTLSVGPDDSLLYVGIAFVLGQMVILGMATIHLGHFTVRRWFLLLPAFALSEVAGELLTSLALILPGWERVGSTRAVMADWPGIAVSVFLWRLLVLVVYSTLLAGVVQLVRYLIVKRERREHTLDAVHHEAGGKN